MPHTTSIGNLHKAASHSPLRGASPITAGGGGPGTHLGSLRASASVLLSQDTELQKALADEKLRSDQHRNHYQLLKAEHAKLQDAHAALEMEFQRSLEAERQNAERLRRSLSEAQRQGGDLRAEVDRLRETELTPQRLENVRLKAAEELEAVYKERFARLSAEVEAHRGEANRLRYEQSFLKSEFEHQSAEQNRMMEEMRLVHEAEVGNLRREREELMAGRAGASVEDSERVKALHKENAQLQVRLKAKSSELDDLLAQKEHWHSNTDCQSRTQARQLSETASSLRQLQAEKESLKQQMDMLQREINQLQAQNAQQASRVHELEKENSLLKHRVEEVTHKSQLNLSNLKLEMTRQRGEIERQRDLALGKVEEAQYAGDLARAKAAALEKAIREKEVEATQREAAAREEEWQKVSALETEKGELETELAEARRRVTELSTGQSVAVDQVESRLREAEAERQRVTTEREAQRRRADAAEAELKTRLGQAVELDEALDRAAEAEADLQRQSAELGELRKEREELREETARTRERCAQVERSKEEALFSREAAWRDDREQLQARTRELEVELASLHEKLAAFEEEAKRRKKRYARYILRQKQQLELASAKTEELVTENEVLRRNVAFEEHAKVKRQLKEMKSRHQEFRDLLMSAPCTHTAQTHKASEEDLQHQEDIQLLRERLEQLDSRQQEQMQELASLRMTPLDTDNAVEEAGDQ